MGTQQEDTGPFLLSYIDCMHLFINGEEKTFAGQLSLAELIERLGMKGDRVAVELNREIVARAQWAETQLNDGDRLEIVHFVGGGATDSCCIPVEAPGFSPAKASLQIRSFSPGI